ncbi:hypothetical protein M9Y10_010466 [Tritrichomonas musculus]|uniref:Uncharacterized protein n=1 Tax=Tritrichomonas musculus TaxID=1915356 RepID=A0ABR2IMA8_9EUKA
MQNRRERSKQDKYEADFVAKKLADFNYKDSKAWQKLSAKFGEKINLNEALSLAEIVSYHLDIQLYREYRRRKSMLIKWFDENLELIWPFIEQKITVCNSVGKIL